MGIAEYKDLNNRIDSIIAYNGITKAVQMLVDENLCPSKSQAKRLYYQKKGRHQVNK